MKKVQAYIEKLKNIEGFFSNHDLIGVCNIEGWLFDTDMKYQRILKRWKKLG